MSVSRLNFVDAVYQSASVDICVLKSVVVVDNSKNSIVIVVFAVVCFVVAVAVIVVNAGVVRLVFVVEDSLSSLTSRVRLATLLAVVVVVVVVVSYVVSSTCTFPGVGVFDHDTIINMCVSLQSKLSLQNQFYTQRGSCTVRQ